VARLGIGRTFQHAELVPHLSVLENILLGRHIHTRATWWQALAFWGGAHREQIEHLRAAEEIIEFLELERYRWKPAAVLSHGVQRLVGLARALAMEPSLLLLDEPSSGMSREEREDFARFLIRLQRERPMTVVWIEHDMQLVRDLADRAVVMHYGQKIAEGSPQDALGDDEVRSAYLGEASPPTPLI
jgi:branched-chain amino acid transport system ATP-binding protein